jgi:hypothetical protein
MKPEENIIHSWIIPKTASDYLAEQALHRAKIVLPILLSVTTIILITFWLALKRLMFGVEFLFSFHSYVPLLSIIYVIFPFLYLYNWFLIKHSKIKYSVSSKGIHITSSNKIFYPWEKFECFIPIEEEVIPETKVIALRLKRGRRRYLHLPDTNLVAEVIQTLENKLPLCQTEITLRLTVYHWMFLFVFSCVYYTCLLCLFLFEEVQQIEWLPQIFLLLTVCLGPGTLGLLLLFGRKSFKSYQLFSLAVLWNMAFLAMTMIISSIIALIYFVCQIKRAGG